MTCELFDQAQQNILNASNYANFKEALIGSQCAKCPLHEFRTNIVVDRGNPDARVLIIGEGPGANEDLQGKAFVGRSGKLLDRLLLELGFDTNRDSLIANVVKCRPPENRAPKPGEVKVCKPYLIKQIELIRPSVILLLGAVAFRHMIKAKTAFAMKNEAGNFFTHPDYPGTQFMVLYHPAFILRNPRKTHLMIEHLRRFKAYWDELCAYTS